MAAAQREATEARGLTRGLVAVGVLPTIAPYLLPQVLPLFSAQYPGIEVVVHEDTTAQLLERLLAGELDLGIASLPIPDPRFGTETLFSEELLLALPSGHRLLRRPRIQAADLAAERFILMKEGHCLGDQVMDFCNRRDFHPNVLCRSAQIETLRALVQVGMGISLIPAMARVEGGPRSVQYRSLAAPRPQRAVAAVWHLDRPPGRTANAFLQPWRGWKDSKPG